MAKETPMIKQYKELKAQYEDAFLFFRLGDFYEMFFDDAVLAARELEITLTKRGQGEDQIPMCGVPFHSAEQYITRLIEKGYKIAICEQMENPQEAKGVVKRDVVRMITPGTVMEGNAIQEKENNFIGTVHMTPADEGVFVRTDLTTGEIAATKLSTTREDWINEIERSKIKELVVSEQTELVLQPFLTARSITLSIEESESWPEEMDHVLEGINDEEVRKAWGRLAQYLFRTQKRSLEHLQAITYYKPTDHMRMDEHSRRNLELIETIRDKTKKGSLLWLIDRSVTAMGGRLLKKWLGEPLLDQPLIERRHDFIDTVLSHFFEREEIRDSLRDVYDLERLAGKVAYGNVNARELVQLRRSLQQLPRVMHQVKELRHPYGDQLVNGLDQSQELLDLLETSLVDDPPISIKEGGIIREGFHDQLDQYRDASRNGKEWISELELEERKVTGIKSLKVGFNKVFGYYIEVTRPNIPYLPEGRYERKQTLTNAERFITPELKEKESLILQAEERMEQLEYELFIELREQVKDYVSSLQQMAKNISELDVLLGFAKVSEENNYIRPTFSKDRTLKIREGRHPVVEQVLPDGNYVTNDVDLNQSREMLLITGPNMAGKSTYMRQIALISIMAQIGCFVPADEVELPIFDQVFTRIGAADDLASGQSTFMVEMLETKHALNKATSDSLILLDEIGRGTSTYDGMALAQSIIEYIHDYIGAKTLFSTHYHELTELDQTLKKLSNVHVSAMEENGEVVFLHKVVEGCADQSYGIYVAKLAALPSRVIERATILLDKFEGKSDATKHEEESGSLEKQIQNTPYDAEIAESNETSDEDVTAPTQLSLFPQESVETPTTSSTLKKTERDILEAIRKTDVLHLSPLQALEKLYELQKRIHST